MNLYPHQVEGLKQTEGKQNCALYWDMGLGKTFGGSEKMRKYGNRVNLVICQKSKIQDWFNHFYNNYSDLGYSFLVLTNKNELEYFSEMSLNRKATLKVIGIINYELAWRRKELLQLKEFTLLLDESSLIQNPTAKQSKFVLKLGDNAKNVILLSGTPTSGRYENLWTQIHLLGWNISRKLYESQYVNWETLQLGQNLIRIPDRKDPYKNVERLKRKLRENGAVFMKTEECFELPEQTFIEINVKVSSEYRKFMKTSVVTLEDGSELIGDTILTKLLYARELCGQYSKLKLEAFRSLVESTNDRLIVFYNFTPELAELEGIAHSLDRPYSLITGSCKRLDEYETDDNSLTFVQYQAGAMGLNLQKANKIIYYSLPLRSELFEQSKKRIHRIGQEKPCFYYIMKCTGSAEEKIYKTLQMRKDFTDELFKDC